MGQKPGDGKRDLAEDRKRGDLCGMVETVSIQLALIQDTRIKKTLINDVDINSLVIHPANPRQTRLDEDIDKLAERISRNGFELTRALWVTENGTGYQVFAGGNRLEAARRAACKTVPVILHDGVTTEDVVRLAYQDNEDDEYHAPVSIVDVWANYAQLASQGWTQTKIAEVMEENPARVSERIKWNSLPEAIKKFFQQKILDEGHLREITSSFNVERCLSPWLPTDQAQLELCQEAAKRKLSTRDTKKLVDKWKQVVEFAAQCYQDISDPDYQTRFVESLANKDARTKAQVNEAYSQIVKAQAYDAEQRTIELARQQSEAEAERLRLEQEQSRQREIEAILSHLHTGDFRQVCQKLNNESVDCIITDPPYPAEYLPLYEDLAKQAARLLKPGGSLFVMCGQSHLPKILNLMSSHIDYQWTLAYLTPGGQAVQLWQKSVITFWKPILWFVKGEYQSDWLSDVLKSNTNDKRYHDWGQSESGIFDLVSKFTQPGDTILDPFLGGGTAALVSLKEGRKFIGIDNDSESIRTSKDRIFNELFAKE